jgi:hypothetical protein
MCECNSLGTRVHGQNSRFQCEPMIQLAKLKPRPYGLEPLLPRPIVQILGIKLLFRFLDALWPDAHADGKENTRIIACRSLESVVVAMAKQPSEDGESVEVGRIDGCGRRLMRRIGA